MAFGAVGTLQDTPSEATRPEVVVVIPPAWTQYVQAGGTRAFPPFVKDGDRWAYVYDKIGKQNMIESYDDWGPAEFKAAQAVYRNLTKKFGPNSLKLRVGQIWTYHKNADYRVVGPGLTKGRVHVKSMRNAEKMTENNDYDFLDAVHAWTLKEDVESNAELRGCPNCHNLGQIRMDDYICVDCRARDGCSDDSA